MATRVLGWVIVLVVIVYHGLRLSASQCSGAACDWFIPFSLLLPIAALVLAGIAGGMAAHEARARPRWAVALVACAVLGSIGPIVVAFAVSDNDTKVWVATVLVLTVPVTVGMRPLWRPTTIN